MERWSSVVGDPLNDPGFRFAPTNAKGVLLLFVRKIDEFQMYVEEVQEEFPDCIVRQRTERGWKRLAVLCSFYSSPLRTQGSTLSSCDLVVCWEHDWPDCPLEVIKLRIVRLDTAGAPARAGERQRLGGYLTRQPAHMQRVFRHLDQGIRSLAPHILIKTTRGRKGAGGVSYYAPERRFCGVDFLRTGRGMTFSVFTGGQRWEGVKPSLSAPWGFLTVCAEADLRADRRPRQGGVRRTEAATVAPMDLISEVRSVVMVPSPPSGRPRQSSSAVKRDIHVLLAAVDLLRQGFAVFRKLARTAPCDFVIVHGRRCWRVTVRTVYSVSPRERIFPRSPLDPEWFEVLAYVMPDGVIRYEPPLEHLLKPDTGTAMT